MPGFGEWGGAGARFSCRLDPPGGFITDEIKMPMSDPFDAYLRRPSRRRLAAVVRAYHDFVWRTAFRIAGNEDEARDVCQDVFLGILLEPPSPQSVVSPHGYLTYRVLARVQSLHRSLERRREREREYARRLLENGSGRPGPDAVDLEALGKAIRELPEELRVPVELRHLGGFSTPEIAAALDVSDRTVQRRLEEAQERLRRRLHPLLASLALLGVVAPASAAPAPPPDLLPALLRITRWGKALAAPGVPAPVMATNTSTLVIGGIIMTKKLAVTAVVALSLGFGLWGVASRGHPVPETLPLAGAETRDLRVRIETLERDLEAIRAERDALVRADQERQEREAAGNLPVSADAKTVEDEQAEAEDAGINWSDLESLMARNVGLLGKRREDLGPEERAQMSYLRAEIEKNSALARALKALPLFDRQIFDALTRSLFKGSLELTDDQLDHLSRVNDAVFAGLPEDVDSLSSLDRWRLRMEMFDRLSRGMEEALDENQMGEWEMVRQFAKDIFDDSRHVEVGTGNIGPENLVRGEPGGSLERLLLSGPPGSHEHEPLAPEILDQISPAADSYLRQGKALVDSYLPGGADPQTLSPEARKEMEGKMLDLQKAFLEQVMPLLPADKQKALQEGPPSLIHFMPGENVRVLFHPSLF
jgi:RNA polymerase sigma-70 factor (ECF subfamily)